MPITWQFIIVLLSISNLLTAWNVYRQHRIIFMLKNIAMLQSTRIDMLREKKNDNVSKV